MKWSFDHVVLVVRDLSESKTEFRSAGFHVVDGGRHVHSGVENALISLANAAYLELFSFVEPERAPRTHSNWPVFDRGGGFGAFWFCTPNLAADIEVIRGAGETIEDPRSGSRLRPDGHNVEFRLAVPAAAERPYMPALIEDVTPRHERVPAYAKHANGIARLNGLTVRVPDLDQTRKFYDSIGAKTHETDRGNSLEIEIGGISVCFFSSEPAYGIQSLSLETESGDVQSIDEMNFRGRGLFLGR